MQALSTSPISMPTSISTVASKSLGGISRIALALGMCAGLALGILAGPRATTTSHHSVAHVSTHLIAQDPSITGGPGDM